MEGAQAVADLVHRRGIHWSQATWRLGRASLLNPREEYSTSAGEESGSTFSGFRPDPRVQASLAHGKLHSGFVLKVVICQSLLAHEDLAETQDNLESCRDPFPSLYSVMEGR